MFRVLIVDDDLMARKLMEIFINSSGRYEAVSDLSNPFMTGLYCIENKVDLILMDILTVVNSIGLETVEKIKNEFSNIDEEKLEQFIGVFMDLQLKSQNSEISTKSIDLRGLIGTLKIIKRGIKPRQAINMGLTNKTFDTYEKEIVEDVIRTRIPNEWNSEDIFSTMMV